MASKQRGIETLSDVVRTCILLFGFLGLIAGFFALNRPESQVPDPVEYESVVDTIQDDYPYDVLAPESTPDTWRATSIDHETRPGGNRWRLGFLIDGDEFVGLEQSDGEIEAYLRERLAGFDEDGASRIDGESWQRWQERDRRPDRALVRRSDDGVATIVRGTASYEALEEFVGWLE
ncbi:DUF4245 domain-containing protein [Actinobacteria bacterium YIM 96077]|uniref:DUF4245 domain-containing protein n=1 Tax=Phytoactinopolyspora halophila TaxID=1981511 RepID=A0A329QHY7_9ACTN|nr:DUF4245 domain-containing protein [Phytoactinopolyspora halophila]AYY14341.1 DUF4245 domain-containing protein [Actinobacteria bacterium YIM 96077]RAW11934.1 hypothetical protein DPM12_15900 [Phytoactinopolyspora halophila]